MKKLKKVFAYAVLTSCVPAMALDLEQALANGKASGHLGVYGQIRTLKGGAMVTNTKGESKKYGGYVSPSASVVYESAPVSFVSLGMGAWANTAIWENVDGDYDGSFGNGQGKKIETNSILHQIYAKVEHPGYGYVKIGRQKVENGEWIADYIQGATLHIGTGDAPNTMGLRAIYAHKRAIVNFDEVSPQFFDLNSNKGVYGALGMWNIAGAIILEPYYFYANDFVQIPGGRFTLRYAEGTETLLRYAHGIAANNQPDGYFFNVDQSFMIPFNAFNISFGGGYIQTDKQAGALMIKAFGDSVRTNENNHIFDPNSRTFYGFFEYGMDELLSLSLVYARIKYDSNAISTHEGEFNASLDYNISKNLQTRLAYINISNKTETEGYDVYKLSLSYQF